MALAAADLWLSDVLKGTNTMGRDLNALAETQEAALDTRLQNHVGTGIGDHDAGYGAQGAQIRRPLTAFRRALDQTTNLLIATAMEVGVVVGAFRACRGSHGQEFNWGFMRV